MWSGILSSYLSILRKNIRMKWCQAFLRHVNAIKMKKKLDMWPGILSGTLNDLISQNTDETRTGSSNDLSMKNAYKTMPGTL